MNKEQINKLTKGIQITIEYKEAIANIQIHLADITTLAAYLKSIEWKNELLQTWCKELPHSEIIDILYESIEEHKDFKEFFRAAKLFHNDIKTLSPHNMYKIQHYIETRLYKEKHLLDRTFFNIIAREE